MGNNQSYENAVTHPRFSKVQYSTNTLSMIVREPILCTQKIIQKWSEKAKLYSHIYNSDDIVRTSEHKIELAGACSGSGTLLVKFEDKYLSTLKQQIAARQLNGKLYTQEEIWHLLLTISRCASHIYSYGEKHVIGNIHPYNILINRKQQYKLMVTNFSFSMPGQLDHFEEYRLHGDSKAFICPQLIGFLTSTKYSDYPSYPQCINKQSAEAYCLGMTLLSMATLETHLMQCFKAQNPLSKKKITLTSHNPSASTLYEQSRQFPYPNIASLSNAIKTVESIPAPLSSRSKPTQESRLSYADLLNQEYFNNLLKIVKERYSNAFYQMINQFLQCDPEVRIKADRLYREFLTPVEKYIQTFDRKWIDILEAQPQNGEEGEEIEERYDREGNERRQLSAYLSGQHIDNK